jgi:hypothetical protein
MVAVRVLETSAAQATFFVYDMKGTPFLQVQLAPPVWTESPENDEPIVVLRAATGPRPRPVIARCQTGSEYGGRRSVYIYDHNGELFGHVIKVMKFSHASSQSQTSEASRLRYVLTSGRTSLQLVFDGNFDKHSITISDEANKVVASTEPCAISFESSGTYYKLRVTESHDVGIILSSLLAIAQMEPLSS